MTTIRTSSHGRFILTLVQDVRSCDIHLSLQNPDGFQAFAAVVAADMDGETAGRRFDEIMEALRCD